MAISTEYTPPWRKSYEGLRIQDSALNYYEIAIRESKKTNDKYAEGVIYGYQCNLLASMKKFDQMLVAAGKSLALSRELQSRQMLASSLYNMAYAQISIITIRKPIVIYGKDLQSPRQTALGMNSKTVIQYYLISRQGKGISESQTLPTKSRFDYRCLAE